MNLLVRMFYVWLISFKKPKLPIGKATSSLRLMTFPNDLDVNLHVNNGRFLTLCDLSRVDLFIRSDLLKVMQQEKWMPVIVEHTMQYKKSLKAFVIFDIIMELHDWDEKSFHMTHKFLVGDKVIAEGTSKGVIRSKTGGVNPTLVLEKLHEYRTKNNITV